MQAAPAGTITRVSSALFAGSTYTYIIRSCRTIGAYQPCLIGEYVRDGSDPAKVRLGYKDLIKVTEKTVRWAEAALKQLDDATASDDAALGRLQASQELLRHYIPLAHQVLSQTERRVLRGEKVKAGDKVVSIFEPHTDIIIEGQPQHNA